jgi:ABC-2 type transport system permease protein/oleandomycin transport system permease protein
MTATAIELYRRRPRALRAVSDAATVAERNLIAYRRIPQLLVFSTIQPVIFVRMFTYVFGGAIKIPGVRYVDYLMPGIFVQTVTFGSMAAAIGLATDLQSGLLERFRSLPMARSAVLAGRTIADLIRNMFVVALMTGVGFAVGFRVHEGVAGLVAGIGFVLLYGYCMAWVFATVGLAVGEPEAAQAAAFPVLAPLVFASSAFVPVTSMPGWLQPFAAHQPVSVTASAIRALTFGGPATWYIVQAVAWLGGILILFAPLAVWRYRKAV